MTCLLKTCCGCFSLRTGMLWITICYLIYFLAIWNSRNSNNPFYVQYGPQITELYMFCGLAASLSAFCGVLWKQRMLVYPLFFYEIFLLIFRVVSYSADFSDHYKEKIFGTIIIQLLMMWLELSYLREPRPVYVPAFTPVPGHPSTSIVINSAPISVSSTSAPPPPMMCPYPVTYAQPGAYPQPTHSTHMYPQMYMPQNVDTSLNNQQMAPPFPYDAPPPYAEKPTAPSAPPLE